MITKRLYHRDVPQPHAPARPATPRSAVRLKAAAGAVLLGLLVGLLVLSAAPQLVRACFEGRIYPHVRVAHVQLGGLRLPDARRALQDAAPDLAEHSGVVTLRAGAATRVVSWRHLGVVLDVDATLRAAYAVGHVAEGRHPARWLRAWREEQALVPILALDLAWTRAALQELAPDVARAPSEPSFRLRGGVVEILPGDPGQELDVEASLGAIVAAAQSGDAGPVALSLRAVASARFDATPLRHQVDTLLAREVRVHAYELVSDRLFTWTLGPDVVAGWLRLVPDEAERRWRVCVDREALRETLAALEAEMGEGVGFRLEEALEAVYAVHAARGGDVWLDVTHAPRTHVVQGGDTALTIAARHGLPLWALVQANPSVDVDLLRLGQHIVIPSQDVLSPFPPVPGKRIVVDLSEQRLYVYENGQLLYDWLCATGRESSPTSAGVFQVLLKEEDAYASLWDLHMPHFVAVYEAGPGFHNGIHALPILPNGRRLWSGALGSPASYGCIILGIEEAKTLYEWAQVGTTVVIRP